MSWKIMLGLFLLIVIVIIGSCIFDYFRFVIVDYTIKSNKVNKTLFIVVITDLHNKQFGHENRHLITKIKQINPDIICIAGDLITANRHPDTFQKMLLFIEEIKAICPIYYTNGNHEYKIKTDLDTYKDSYKEFMGKIQGDGVRLLNNEKVHLPEFNILISGVELERKYFKRMDKQPLSQEVLKEKLGSCEEQRFEILLAHNPIYFSEYVEWGADLILSGHVHGGVAKIPFLGGVIAPSFQLFPKYDGGKFQELGKDGRIKTMILSRGLGAHTIPIRIFNPGELVVVKIQKEGE